MEKLFLKELILAHYYGRTPSKERTDFDTLSHTGITKLCEKGVTLNYDVDAFTVYTSLHQNSKDMNNHVLDIVGRIRGIKIRSNERWEDFIYQTLHEETKGKDKDIGEISQELSKKLSRVGLSHILRTV